MVHPVLRSPLFSRTQAAQGLTTHSCHTAQRHISCRFQWQDWTPNVWIWGTRYSMGTRSTNEMAENCLEGSMMSSESASFQSSDKHSAPSLWAARHVTENNREQNTLSLHELRAPSPEPKATPHSQVLTKPHQKAVPPCPPQFPLCSFLSLPFLFHCRFGDTHR